MANSDRVFYPNHGQLVSNRSEPRGEYITVGDQQIAVREVIDHTFFWTARFDHESWQTVYLTNGERISPERSNWHYGPALPSGMKFVAMSVDARVMSGREDPLLHDILSNTRLELRAGNGPVTLERALIDITVTDSVLEARVEYLERFVTELLRTDHPAAEALKLLGAKPLERQNDYRTITKPFLLDSQTGLIFTVTKPKPKNTVPMDIQIRLRGLLKREVG